MFTYIKLKNFMSFKDATFDFRRGRKNVKNFVAIYGENGSGKSNFVNSVNLLKQSLFSLAISMTEEELDRFSQKGLLLKRAVDEAKHGAYILNLIKNCRMVGYDGETRIEYGFKAGDHEGYYIIGFAERFTYEKLYYFTGKQRGVLFEIKNENGKIVPMLSNKLFGNKKVREDICDEIEKYWGKHTLLSILNEEIVSKNEQYIEDHYAKYILEVLDMMRGISVHHKTEPHFGTEIRANKPIYILPSLDYGEIPAPFEFELDCSERILRDFFTQAYADIKDVFYERTRKGREISYKLYVKKMIGGEIRTVGFENESSGTRRILEIIYSLLAAFCGMTVVYDEIDDGIHDLLLKNILESMLDDITGQLIITTHNTYMLETMDIKSVYLINVDYQGNKEVKCLDQYPRIQGTNNPRNMYLKGLFGGVPIVDALDYDFILNELRSNSSPKEGSV